MNYRILILPRASEDLTEIYSYIEKDSPQNAVSVAARIIKAIDSLEILPRRYKIHQRRSDPMASVHSMPVPPFIVYYRVNETHRAVRVLTIMHGARRQPKRFE